MVVANIIVKKTVYISVEVNVVIVVKPIVKGVKGVHQVVVQGASTTAPVVLTAVLLDVKLSVHHVQQRVIQDHAETIVVTVVQITVDILVVAKTSVNLVVLVYVGILAVLTRVWINVKHRVFRITVPITAILIAKVIVKQVYVKIYVCLFVDLDVNQPLYLKIITSNELFK